MTPSTFPVGHLVSLSRLSVKLFPLYCILLILFSTSQVWGNQAQADPGKLSVTGQKPSEIGELLSYVAVLPDDSKHRDEIEALYDELFEAVLKSSPQITIALHTKNQKLAQRHTSFAERWAPQVDFSLSREHKFNHDEDDNNSSSSANEFQDGSEVTEWSFKADFPLYRKRTSVALQTAEEELSVADHTFFVKVNELGAQLHKLLGDYMVAVYRLLNLQNSVKLSAEYVGRIERGYQLRDQTRLAMLRAQANLKELEARIDIERQRQDTTLRALLDFTGLDSDDEFIHRLNWLLREEVQAAEVISGFAQVDETLRGAEIYLSQMDQDQLLAFYKANSFLYRQLELEKAQAMARSERFVQGEYPDLAIKGDVGRKEDTRFEDFIAEGSLGLYLNVPVFSGGTLAHNIRTKSEAQQVAVEQFYDQNRKLFNQIMNRRKTIISLSEIYQKQKINLLQQAEIVELSIKSYTIKQTSMQDLLTSKNRLINAKNQLIKSTMDISSQVQMFLWELGVLPSGTIEAE